MTGIANITRLNKVTGAAYRCKSVVLLDACHLMCLAATALFLLIPKSLTPCETQKKTNPVQPYHNQKTRLTVIVQLIAGP